MNHLKRVLSLVLVLSLIISMAVPALAENSVSVSVNNVELAQSEQAQTANVVFTFDEATELAYFGLTFALDAGDPVGATVGTCSFSLGGTASASGLSWTSAENVSVPAGTSVTIPVEIAANATGTWHLNITIDPDEVSDEDGENVILSDYSLTATVTVTTATPEPTPTPEPQTYTVTWSIDGVTTSETLAEGTVPSHAAPTKAADAQYTYTFAGWSDGTTTYGPSDALPAVSADVTYTAIFSAQSNTPIVQLGSLGGWRDSDDYPLDEPPGTSPKSQYYYSDEYVVTFADGSAESSMTFTVDPATDGRLTFDYISTGGSDMGGWGFFDDEEGGSHLEAQVTGTDNEYSFSFTDGGEDPGEIAWGTATVYLKGGDHYTVTLTHKHGGADSYGMGDYINGNTYRVGQDNGYYPNGEYRGYITNLQFTEMASVTSPVTVTFNDEYGTVTGNSFGTLVSGEQHELMFDVKETLVATPAYGYKFVGWYEGETQKSTNTYYYITGAEGTSFDLEARFEPAELKNLTVTFPEGVQVEVLEQDKSGTYHSLGMLTSGEPIQVHETHYVRIRAIKEAGAPYVNLYIKGGPNGTYNSLNNAYYTPSGDTTFYIEDNYQEISGYTAPEYLVAKTAASTSTNPYPWAVYSGTDTDKEGSLVTTNQKKKKTLSSMALIPAYNGIIYFDYKVSSQANYDILLYRNGTEITTSNYSSSTNYSNRANFSGDQTAEWKTVSVTVTAGKPLFIAYWKYNNNTHTGSDTAWIKNIRFEAQAPVPVHVNISTDDGGDPLGTVTTSGIGENDLAAYNDLVTLTAAPLNDHVLFDGWYEVVDGVVSDRALSTEASYSYNALTERTLLAKFHRRAVYTATVEIPNDMTATISVDGGEPVALTSNVPYEVEEKRYVTIQVAVDPGVLSIRPDLKDVTPEEETIGSGMIIGGNGGAYGHGAEEEDETGIYSYIARGNRVFQAVEAYTEIEGFTAPQDILTLTDSNCAWEWDAENGWLVTTNQGQKSSVCQLVFVAEEAGALTLDYKVSSYYMGPVDMSSMVGQFLSAFIESHVLYYRNNKEITTTYHLNSDNYSEISDYSAYSGEVDWTTATFYLNEGDKLFFGYYKDSYGPDAGDDTCWLRNVSFVQGTPHTVSVTKEETGGTDLGAVTATGVTEGVAQFNAPVTVKATPTDHAVFDGWFENDELVSTIMTYEFNAVADRALVAKFHEKRWFDLTVNYDSSKASVSCQIGEGDENQLVSGEAVSVYEKEWVTLKATPADGYQFMGWYNASNERLSTATTYLIRAASENTALTARFVPVANDPIASINDCFFDDLETAFANAIPGDVVVLTADYTQSANITVPAGVTLLIPCDDANTLFTNETFDASDAYFVNEYAYTTQVNRTLTLTDGAKLTVNGALSVASRAYEQATGPIGPYGLISLDEGTNITMASGSKLYAFGYIQGSGTVTVMPGARVYENMFIVDYPGSASTTIDIMNAGAFPFSDFTVRNVEVPMTFRSGAAETVMFNFYGSMVGYHHYWIDLIGANGSGALFTAESNDTYVVKSYVNGRQIISLVGDAQINGMMIAGIKTSGMSGIPIPYNYDITMSGGTLNITENIILSRGSKTTVASDATLNIPEGVNLYVLDKDDDTQVYGKSLGDAELDINGTVNVSGGLLTSAHGANIHSSENTGALNFNADAASETEIHLKKAKGKEGTITLTAAQLHNADDTYVQTADVTANTTFYYLNGAWVNLYTVTIDADKGCDVTVTADGKTVRSGDEVATGTELTVTATAREGYTLTETPNGTYTVTGPVTITARSEAKSFTLTVQKVVDGAADGEPVVYPVAFGRSVTVTAEEKAGYEFLGWYEPNGMLLTTDMSYTAIVCYNTTIEARYQNHFTATFVSNNQVILTKGAAGVTAEEISALNPSPLDGFEFLQWDLNGTKYAKGQETALASAVNDALAGGNVTVTAEFKVKVVTYTVTIYNGEAETPTVTDYTESQIVNERAAEVEGKVFAYWQKLVGENTWTPFSYAKLASFRATENITLRAVYDVEEAVPTGTATIKSATYNSGTKKATFVAYTTVPDNSKIVKAGLVAARSDAFEGELTTSNAQYVKSLAAAVGKCAPVNYTWNKGNVNPGDVWCARAYLVYTYQGVEYTIYGDLVTLTCTN